MSLSQALKHYFNIYFGLTPNQQREFFLIDRYYDKCSDRLKARHLELLTLAGSGSSSLLKEYIYKPNPLLDMIKATNFTVDNMWSIPIIINPNMDPTTFIVTDVDNINKTVTVKNIKE